MALPLSLSGKFQAPLRCRAGSCSGSTRACFTPIASQPVKNKFSFENKTKARGGGSSASPCLQVLLRRGVLALLPCPKPHGAPPYSVVQDSWVGGLSLAWRFAAFPYLLGSGPPRGGHCGSNGGNENNPRTVFFAEFWLHLLLGFTSAASGLLSLAPREEDSHLCSFRWPTGCQPAIFRAPT